jgi:protein-S-isoprenylcysteine O-methyltransferase Ste14
LVVREEHMCKMNLIALLHALSGAGALVASLHTGTDLWATVRFVKPLGYAIFAGGTLLFVVSVVYLKRAFLGEVEPVTDRLITNGPYRLVRHPLYLGMFVATIGLAVAFRSVWGMLIGLVVFVPAGLWRARLEEEALARRFGVEWENYAARTYFILPPVY